MEKVRSYKLLPAAFCLSLVTTINAFCQQNKPVTVQQTEVPMPAGTLVIPENYLNTVTTTDTNGVKYKLVLIGDLLPRFFVNSHRVNIGELKSYSDIINKLSLVLWQRQKKATEEKKTSL